MGIDARTAKVVQHAVSETTQVKDIRKIFLNDLASNHVQHDLEAGGKTRESAYVPAARPAQTTTQSQLLETVAPRAAEAAVTAIQFVVVVVVVAVVVVVVVVV
jgi:hypothetical protein